LCEEKLRTHVEIHYSDDDRSEFEIRKGGASIAQGLIVIDFGRASCDKKLFSLFSFSSEPEFKYFHCNGKVD
jgi:hypothetical protein